MFLFAEWKGLIICRGSSVSSRSDLNNLSFQVSSGSTDVLSVQLFAALWTTRGVWADVQDPMLGHSINLQSPPFPIPFTCLPAHYRARLQSNSGPITQEEHWWLLTLCSIDFHGQESWLWTVNMILKACGSHRTWSLGSAHATQNTRTHPDTVSIKVPRSFSPEGHQVIYNESHFADLWLQVPAVWCSCVIGSVPVSLSPIQKQQHSLANGLWGTDTQMSTLIAAERNTSFEIKRF